MTAFGPTRTAPAEHDHVVVGMSVDGGRAADHDDWPVGGLRRLSRW